jgi:hypothetical protein
LFDGNGIDLNGVISEEELVEEMRVINAQKYELSV